jgi:hypothetical protein
MSYYPPTTHSCICPNCLQKLYFQNQIKSTRCDKCNLVIIYSSYECQIVLEGYTLDIIFSTKKVFIISRMNVEHSHISFYLEEEFDWDNINLYYKTSLKYIENMVFM